MSKHALGYNSRLRVVPATNNKFISMIISNSKISSTYEVPWTRRNSQSCDFNKYHNQYSLNVLNPLCPFSIKINSCQIILLNEEICILPQSVNNGLSLGWQDHLLHGLQHVGRVLGGRGAGQQPARAASHQVLHGAPALTAPPASSQPTPSPL